MLMSPRRIRGFTLIELLVVVAIIALLIAILLPALSNARSLSRQTICLANLKGQGNVLALYDSENTRYPIGQREQLPSGWSAPPYGGEWSRAWSSAIPNLVSRGDLKFDMRRNFGDATYSNASIGGSGKLWICPGTTPQYAIYQYADDPTPGIYIGAATGPRYWYYSAYLMLWSEPGNRLNGSNLVTNDSKWTRVISGSGTYGGVKGPKNSRSDPRKVLIQDLVGYELGGSAQLAYTNHARNAGTNYGGMFAAGNERHLIQEAFTAPADTYNSFIVGASTLYNDGHAEFVRTANLTPVQFGGILQKSTAATTVLLIDLTEDQK